jgi:glycosyltransferase involved in cell wall biosynthesis
MNVHALGLSGWFVLQPQLLKSLPHEQPLETSQTACYVSKRIACQIMPPPRVSVIITSYNQQEYLREAIESTIEQTMAAFEIIVADDHSTKDGSVEAIREYTAKYPGLVRGVFQETNVGIPKNRNSALQIVKGDHVVILDGDDRLLPRFIEQHGAALAANPQAHVSYSNRYDINQLGERYPRNRRPQPSGDVFVYVARGRKGILHSMVAKYDLIKAAGFLDENHYHYDGFILTLRLAKLTPFVYLSEPLMEKRHHAEGTSKGISIAEKEQCFQDLLAEVMRVTAELPAKDKRTITKSWLARISQLYLEAKIEEGDWSGACMELARRVVADPRRIKASLKMMRDILSRARHT